MKRVLQYGNFGVGGVQSFIMNIYRNIDREKIQFDFILPHDGGIAYESEILDMGGRIFRCIYSKRESIIKHHRSWCDFYEKYSHDFCALHMHMNQIRYYAPLVYAERYGIKKRIYHSHTSSDMNPSNSIIKKLTEFDTRINLSRYATDLFACSDSAGRYMFGNKKFNVIPNAIETDKFIFNEGVRKKKREELRLGDKFVIGTVGHLSYIKNPEFAVEIFNAVHRKNPNSELIMVGIGALEDKIKQMIADYKLTDCVQLLGRRYDVPELMQAFDCFLMPSRFEGLGIVYIEAQAAGLACFASEGVVPMEAKVTELMNYIPLDKPAEFWADRILASHIIERRNMKSEIIKSGYDIKDLAQKLQYFYLEKEKI